MKLNLTPALFVFPVNTYECGYAADEQSLKLQHQEKLEVIQPQRTNMLKCTRSA